MNTTAQPVSENNHSIQDLFKLRDDLLNLSNLLNFPIRTAETREVIQHGSEVEGNSTGKKTKKKATPAQIKALTKARKVRMRMLRAARKQEKTKKIKKAKGKKGVSTPAATEHQAA